MCLLAVNTCEPSLARSRSLTWSTMLTCPGSFNIGYMYSFVAAGVFYWAFNRFFPHTESIMDHAETGEDIIAATDEKHLRERRESRAERRPSMVARMFEV